LFYITVPLRDLSIVNYGPGGASGVEVGQGMLPPAPVINVTCPLAGEARAGDVIPALNVAAVPRSPARVVVVSAGTVPVSAPAIEVATPGGDAGPGIIGQKTDHARGKVRVPQPVQPTIRPDRLHMNPVRHGSDPGPATEGPTV
jgi:hypothetical protein